MLMGIDLDSIQIVIFVRPVNLLHHLVQGAGRAGRRMASGFRQKVLVYILFNSQDLGANVPGLDDTVRLFCTCHDCLRKMLKQYFDGLAPESLNCEWCCSSCDKSD